MTCLEPSPVVTEPYFARQSPSISALAPALPAFDGWRRPSLFRLIGAVVGGEILGAVLLWIGAAARGIVRIAPFGGAKDRGLASLAGGWDLGPGRRHWLGLRPLRARRAVPAPPGRASQGLWVSETVGLSSCGEVTVNTLKLRYSILGISTSESIPLQQPPTLSCRRRPWAAAGSPLLRRQGSGQHGERSRVRQPRSADPGCSGSSYLSCRAGSISIPCGSNDGPATVIGLITPVLGSMLPR